MADPTVKRLCRKCIQSHATSGGLLVVVLGGHVTDDIYRVDERDRRDSRSGW
jgi:hypothetical protein